jgi:hypothetical protein
MRHGRPVSLFAKPNGFSALCNPTRETKTRFDLKSRIIDHFSPTFSFKE